MSTSIEEQNVELNAAPSPLPWRVSGFEVGAGAATRTIMAADDFSVCYVNERTPEENYANADFIVQSCNEIASLKGILSDPKKWMRWCDIRVLEANKSLTAERDSLLAQRKELVEALKGLALRKGTDDSLCWCNAWDWTKHKPECAVARDLVNQDTDARKE